MNPTSANTHSPSQADTNNHTLHIGYEHGNLHYKGASGREGDWFRLGFAPRKGNMTIYFLCDMRRLGDSLAKLSKHSASGGCLHIKKLSDIHLPTLKGMLVEAYKITPTEQISVSTKTKPASKKIAAKKVAAKKVAAKKVAAKKVAAKKVAAKSTTAKKSTARKGR